MLKIKILSIKNNDNKISVNNLINENLNIIYI